MPYDEATLTELGEAPFSEDKKRKSMLREASPPETSMPALSDRFIPTGPRGHRHLVSGSFVSASRCASVLTPVAFMVNLTRRLFTGWRSMPTGRLRRTQNDSHGACPGSEDSEQEKEFAHLMLVSEARRFAILARLLTGLTGLVAAFGVVAYGRGVVPAGYSWILMISSLACTYEWVASWYIAEAVRRRLEPARFRFYLNALVELSIPVAMTMIAAAYTNPAHALAGPASYSYFLFITLSALRLDFFLCLFTGVMAALAYFSIGMMHWSSLQQASSEPALTLQFSLFVRSLLFALGGLVAALVSLRIRVSLMDTLRSMRERERVIGLFGQHVSQQVVDRLLSQPADDPPHLRGVCVLVLDLRSFTTFAEKRSPKEVVLLLNALWDFMVRAVNENHGFINKFLGDGFLAVFGAPFSAGNDCQNAAHAACRILRELDEHSRSGALPPIQVGMAIHAGNAIVGNIGSAERKEYTVIGDVVNVAFRLEACNKEFGSRLLVSEPVWTSVAGIGGESVGKIGVRGREEPIEVFQIA